MDLRFELHPLMGQYRTSFSFQYSCKFYITRLTKHWQNIRLKGVCRTVWEKNSTGHTWRATYRWLQEIAERAPEASRRINTNSPYNYFQRVPTGICGDGHPRTTPEDVQRQPESTGNDGSLFKFTVAVPTSKTTASQILSYFMNIWIIPYGIPTNLWMGHGTQLVSKLF